LAIALKEISKDWMFSFHLIQMNGDGQGNTNMQKHNPEDIANASLQVTIASL